MKPSSVTCCILYVSLSVLSMRHTYSILKISISYKIGNRHNITLLSTIYDTPSHFGIFGDINCFYIRLVIPHDSVTIVLVFAPKILERHGRTHTRSLNSQLTCLLSVLLDISQ